MSDYVPNEPAEVVIGVCGEQGAGKTVFLTCIFQSIWTAVADDVILDFDRKKIGNATYFQGIEDALLQKGPTQGTLARSSYPARIYVKPYEPLPEHTSSMLSVDILDFAGRHFRSIADLKNMLEENEADAAEMKTLREVNETLERADAFVILINSTEIDPVNDSPKRNPFGPSVNFMLAHCRAERKPVALLFSQIDQTPYLTDELFHSLPRIQAFERQFTASHKEAASPGGRPFGIARRISCYETVEGDLVPRSQSGDGNIWRPEPAQVVLELLRAAMPAIKKHQAEKAREAEKARQKKTREEERKRKRNWTFAIAALIGLLLVIGILAFALLQKMEGKHVLLLRTIEGSLHEGNIASITPALEAQLDEVLRAQRTNSGIGSSLVRAAVRHLESAVGEAEVRLVGEPSLDAAYAEKIARFQSLVPHFDPIVSAGWRQALPLLAARRDFLAGWLGASRQGRRERARYLDEAAKRFEDGGDRPFASLLAAQSTGEKKAEVASWQIQIDADADVLNRLATIQNILASTVGEQDPEFKQLARKALAGQVTSTILKRSENGLLREKLFTPLVPDLTKFADGEVRFEVLARELLNCANKELCESRQAVVQSVITDANTNTQTWKSAVENLLHNLLLDLPPQERRDVWQDVAASIDGSYIFSGRPDAWPGDVGPLHARIAAAANGASDSTPVLIELLAQQPLYTTELNYLKDRLAAMELRRTMVPIYSTILSVLSQREGLLPSDDVSRVSQQMSTALAGRVPDGPLAEVIGEINQVRDLVQAVNNLRSHGTSIDSSAPSRLERLLHDAKRGDCEALASHGAPTECSNAA
jgi:hypothetical protein